MPSTGTSSPEFMSYLHGLGGKAVVTMLGTCRLSSQDRCTSCQKTAEEYQLDIALSTNMTEELKLILKWRWGSGGKCGTLLLSLLRIEYEASAIVRISLSAKVVGSIKCRRTITRNIFVSLRLVPLLTLVPVREHNACDSTKNCLMVYASWTSCWETLHPY